MKCESADGRVQTRASDPRSLGLDQTGTARARSASPRSSSELHGRRARGSRSSAHTAQRASDPA